VTARPLLRGWCFSFAGWGALALLLAAQHVYFAGVSWTEALRPIAGECLAWAVVTPLLFLLTARLPVEKTTWRRAVPAQIAAGLAALGLVIGARALVAGGLPEPPPRSFPPPAGGHFGERPDFPPGQPPEGPPNISGPPRGPPGLRPPHGSLEWFFRLRLPLHLPMLLLVMVASHALHFYRRGQERERQALQLTAHLAQARLDALTMQIQPHFLFNALNSIAALVHKDADAADEMIGALSEFLRCTLHGSARREVPLIEELEYVRRYLAIEQVRFGDRLRYETDVPPETFGALVPMLILQPLVENAVRHGLSSAPGPGGASGPARLSILARREDGELHLSVADNGAGLGQSANEGIGLTNTRARLRELHGEAGRVELRAGNGCTVELVLPFRIA